jgi:hypothetical protein
MMFMECRYCKPLVASANFGGISGFGVFVSSENDAYETKAVNPGMHGREVHDVPVNRPFRNDA